CISSRCASSVPGGGAPAALPTQGPRKRAAVPPSASAPWVEPRLDDRRHRLQALPVAQVVAAHRARPTPPRDWPPREAPRTVDREGGDMKISAFHLMPHRELPADFEQRYESVWVTPPWWELADARRVGQYYNWTLDELLHAARSGFDG